MKSILFFLIFSSFGLAGTCDDWFDKSKIQQGTNCIKQCVVLPTGMGNWECPNECERLCKKTSLLDAVLGKMAYYPALNKAENELVAKKPKEAFTVFLQKNKAEEMTDARWGRDGDGDESDAYRHFVWAALLRRELGAETAKEFLDAHEATGGPDTPDKAMDLANNRAGLIAAESMLKRGKMSDDDIGKAADDAINNKSLVILKPQGGKTK